MFRAGGDSSGTVRGPAVWRFLWLYRPLRWGPWPCRDPGHGGRSYQSTLGQINGSSASGTKTVDVKGDQAHAVLKVSGLAATFVDAGPRTSSTSTLEDMHLTSCSSLPAAAEKRVPAKY
ncbi:hypothetical protein ABIB26_004114 [Arthrobacter sp. UYEF20]